MSNETTPESRNENNEIEELTIQEFKQIKGFEQISEHEVTRISGFIYEIAQMLYNYEFKQGQNE